MACWESSYLWIKIIQCFNSCLNVAAMYTILDLLSGNDGRGLLVRGQVGLLGEIGCCVRIALHGEIIQD